MRKLLAIFAALAVVGGVGAVAFIYSGLYDISATDQHLRLTFHAMDKAMERSVERRARKIPVPALGAPEQLERGVALFRKHCVQCHGGPGVAPDAFALALRPLPVPLVRTGHDKPPEYLFWIAKNGIKMTGMPAFEFRLDDADLWAVVAFVRHLPKLSPDDYRAMRGAPLTATEPPLTGAPHVPLPGGPPDLARGKRALEQYACVGCHEIPGLVGPEARVGPTLHGVGARGILGGVLPNTPENMARWIREPQRVAPGTAMPDLGVTARDARDMAAHLATLR